jgi:hypothetical protein
MAAPTTVHGGVGSAMLLRDDVLDMKTGHVRGSIWQVTVLTPKGGALTNSLSEGTPQA